MVRPGSVSFTSVGPVPVDPCLFLPADGARKKQVVQVSDRLADREGPIVGVGVGKQHVRYVDGAKRLL